MTATIDGAAFTANCITADIRTSTNVPGGLTYHFDGVELATSSAIDIVFANSARSGAITVGTSSIVNLEQLIAGFQITTPGIGTGGQLWGLWVIGPAYVVPPSVPNTFPGGSGTIQFTTLSSSRASATFTWTVAPVPQNTQTAIRRISGSFDVAF